MTSNGSNIDNKPKKTFQEDLVLLLEYICRNTSSHGSHWYQVLRTKWMKVLFLLLSIVLQSVVLMAFISGMFLQPPQSITSSQIMNRVPMAYPGITFCVPNVFNASKLERWNISKNLSNYILSGVMFETLLYDQENLKNFQLEKEFQELLKSTRGGYKELLDELALKCTDIIMLCQHYGTLIGNQECCQLLFNKGPFVTQFGLCFTHEYPERLTEESTYDEPLLGSLRITIRMDGQNFKGYEHMVTRTGQHGNIAFHTDDMAAAILLKKGFSFRKESINKFILTASQNDRQAFREERFDYSDSLGYKKNENTCILEADLIQKVLRAMGFKRWSLLNCKFMFTTAYFRHKCNYFTQLGLDRNQSLIDDLKTENNDLIKYLFEFPNEMCQPKDNFEGNFTSLAPVDNSSLSFVHQMISDYCYPQCKETVLDYSSSSYDMTFSNQEDEAFRNLTAFEIILDTSSQMVHKIRPKTLKDHFSETGGLIGALLGASIISIWEYIYFYSLIIKCFVSHGFKEFFKSKKIRAISKE